MKLSMHALGLVLLPFDGGAERLASRPMASIGSARLAKATNLGQVLDKPSA
jgi:hypothetical protein